MTLVAVTVVVTMIITLIFIFRDMLKDS